MTKVELVDKLSKVENIHNLLDDVQKAESNEAYLKILEQYGVEIDFNELQKLYLCEDELDAEDLDFVAGGCNCGWGRKVIIWGLNTFLKMIGAGHAAISCC